MVWYQSVLRNEQKGHAIHFYTLEFSHEDRGISKRDFYK